MEFNQSVITTRGRQLMAKLLAGKKMNFSKIALSSTEYPQGQLESLTALTNIKQTTTVQAYANNSQTVSVVGAIENTGLTEGYFINTVGLYAIDPDLGEILYSVATAKQNGYIPPDTGVSKSGVQIKVYTEVANASQVDLTVDPASYATQEDIERFKAAGIQEAWANSADGATDFSVNYPSENAITNNRSVLSFTPTTTSSIDYPDLFPIDSKYQNLKDWLVSGDKITIGLEWESNVELTDAVMGLFFKNSPWISNFPEAQNVSGLSGKLVKTGIVNSNLANSKQQSLTFRMANIPVNTIIKITKVFLIKGDTSIYRLNQNEDLLGSIMQYKGIGNKDSANPSDYRWSQSDEYRDYKENKLKQAIIALGGTV